jgi:hypothetical protein
MWFDKSTFRIASVCSKPATLSLEQNHNCEGKCGGGDGSGRACDGDGEGCRAVKHTFSTGSLCDPHAHVLFRKQDDPNDKKAARLRCGYGMATQFGTRVCVDD